LNVCHNFGHNVKYSFLTIYNIYVIKETVVGRTTRQKLKYLGHVMKGNNLEKSVMTGMGEGARGRGHPKMRWLDEVIGSTKLSLFYLRDAVDDRTGWRRYVMGVTRDRNLTAQGKNLCRNDD